MPKVVKASAWVAKNVPDARLVSYGHVGDGNLHFNLSQPANVSAETFLARRAEIQRAIFDLAMSIIPVASTKVARRCKNLRLPEETRLILPLTT